MPLRLTESTAVLHGVVTVEDAEPLTTWLRSAVAPEVDMTSATHLHTAALQSLLAARVKVVGAPADDFLRRWVSTSLTGAHRAVPGTLSPTTEPTEPTSPTEPVGAVELTGATDPVGGTDLTGATAGEAAPTPEDLS